MLRKIVTVVAIAMITVSLNTSIRADEDSLVTFKVLKPEIALELAQATMVDCRKKGYQVAVSVVDRFGILQVTLRDRFAGTHTPETARRKAWTAVSFRTDSGEISRLIKDGELSPSIRHVPGALMLGGGVRVEAAGTMVAGVGVSGAPGGPADEACARAGIEAIADKLPF